MQRLFLVLTGVLVCASGVLAGYDYVITEGYGTLPDLEDNETLLMTGGGGHHLGLYGYSQVVIEGTDPLINEFTGGIWQLSMGGQTQLNLSGGDVHELVMHTYAQALLSGGRIDEIRSYQSAWKYDGDPPEIVPNPHITIVAELDSINHNVGTNVLSGNWLDGTGFQIQLVDVDGYSPVIENIQFIPESATLLLVGAGGLLLRRKRR